MSKQLLQSSGRCVAIGLSDRAYVVVRKNSSNVDTSNLVDEDVQVFELSFPAQTQEKKPPSKQSNSDSNNHYDDDGEDAAAAASGKEELISNETIQAVACQINANASEVLCAASRSDKSIALYKIPIQEANTSEDCPKKISMQPLMIHHSSKRCCNLTFARLPDEKNAAASDGSWDGYILVAGDLAGDVTAYPISSSTQNQNPPQNGESSHLSDNPKSGTSKRKRLLLGHTGSMITGLHVVSTLRDMKILTSDRDDKVRISSFPATFVIQNYLLGHSAFISCLDVVDVDTNNATMCVTGAGDGTIRLWNYETGTQLALVSLDTENGTVLEKQIEEPKLNKQQNPIETKQQTNDSNEDDKLDTVVPSSVSINGSGTFVAVSINNSATIPIFRIEPKTQVDDMNDHHDDVTTLEHFHTVHCPQMPLALSFLDDDNTTLFILTRQPQYVLEYKLKDSSPSSKLLPSSSPLVRAIQTVAIQANISMPTSVLETDVQTGKLTLSKENEKPGFVKHEPWNRIERKEKAKQSDSRRKKQRRQQQQERKRQQQV